MHSERAEKAVKKDEEFWNATTAGEEVIRSGCVRRHMDPKINRDYPNVEIAMGPATTKVIAQAGKYRALKIVQIPTHLRDCPIEKKRLYQTYKLCALFTKITGVQHHVDHMWPLSDGGPHWSGNLQIITATENLSKKDRVEPSIKATIQEMLKDIKDAY